MSKHRISYCIIDANTSEVHKLRNPLINALSFLYLIALNAFLIIDSISEIKIVEFSFYQTVIYT